MKWTGEQDAALKRLWADGFSCTQAAAGINQEFRTIYSRNAVIGRLHRLGLTEPPMVKRIVKRIRKNAAAKVEKPPKPKPRPIKTFVAEAFVARAADVVPRHLPLLDLKPDDCRYPYGNGPFSFCGHGKTAGSSYCFEHDCLTRRA